MIDYIGDILVIESNCWQGRVLTPFTGKYNHTALRTQQNVATALTNEGMEKYYLSDPPKEYEEFKVMRHKKISDLDRRRIKGLDMILGKDYDYLLLLKL